MSMATGTSPLLEAAEAVRSGRVSSEELVTQALKRLEEVEGDVGAFLSVQGRAAVDTARSIDQKVGAPLFRYIHQRWMRFCGGVFEYPGVGSLQSTSAPHHRSSRVEAHILMFTRFHAHTISHHRSSAWKLSFS